MESASSEMDDSKKETEPTPSASSDNSKKETETKVDASSEVGIKKRGRPIKVTWDEQLAVYRQKAKELLDSKNKILPATAQIFDEISRKFEGKMTPKAIQIAVTKRANEIFGENIVQEPIECDSEKLHYLSDEFGLEIRH